MTPLAEERIYSEPCGCRTDILTGLVTAFCPLHALPKKLESERDEAEAKAWDALARYKFQMFGYWAAIWVHLNRLCATRRSNPFKPLVQTARISKEPEREANLSGVSRAEEEI